eukprot:ANDGO_02652.mRNA.1 putative E3 ubiquitin-protein ligase ARI9
MLPLVCISLAAHTDKQYPYGVYSLTNVFVKEHGPGYLEVCCAEFRHPCYVDCYELGVSETVDVATSEVFVRELVPPSQVNVHVTDAGQVSKLLEWLELASVAFERLFRRFLIIDDCPRSLQSAILGTGLRVLDVLLDDEDYAFDSRGVVVNSMPVTEEALRSAVASPLDSTTVQYQLTFDWCSGWDIDVIRLRYPKPTPPHEIREGIEAAEEQEEEEEDEEEEEEEEDDNADADAEDENDSGEAGTVEEQINDLDVGVDDLPREARPPLDSGGLPMASLQLNCAETAVDTQEPLALADGHPMENTDGDESVDSGDADEEGGYSFFRNGDEWDPMLQMINSALFDISGCIVVAFNPKPLDPSRSRRRKPKKKTRGAEKSSVGESALTANAAAAISGFKDLAASEDPVSEPGDGTCGNGNDDAAESSDQASNRPSDGCRRFFVQVLDYGIRNQLADGMEDIGEHNGMLVHRDYEDEFPSAKRVPRRLLLSRVLHDVLSTTRLSLDYYSPITVKAPRVLAASLLRPRSELSLEICSHLEQKFNVPFDCSHTRNFRVRFERNHEMVVRWGAGWTVAKSDLQFLEDLSTDHRAIRVLPLYSRTVPISSHVPEDQRARFLKRVLFVLNHMNPDLIYGRFISSRNAILLEATNPDALFDAVRFATLAYTGRSVDLGKFLDSQTIATLNVVSLLASDLEGIRQDACADLVNGEENTPIRTFEPFIFKLVPFQPQYIHILCPELGFLKFSSQLGTSIQEAVCKSIKDTAEKKRLASPPEILHAIPMCSTAPSSRSSPNGSLTFRGLQITPAEECEAEPALRPLEKLDSTSALYFPASCCLSICSRSDREYVQLPCGHDACVTCIRSQVKQLTLQPNSFVPDFSCRHCQAPISPAFLLRLLGLRTVAEYASRVARPSRSFHCTSPDCGRWLSSFISVEHADGDGMSYTVHCTDCQVSHCAKCCGIDHLGSSCVGQSLFVVMEQGRTRSCPGCRGAVTRNDGCQHMTCRCGSEWCWYCGAVLHPNYIGKHKQLCQVDVGANKGNMLSNALILHGEEVILDPELDEAHD